MLIGILLTALATAEAGAPITTGPEVAEIIRLEDAWRRARIEGDTAFLERFYASEMRVQGMDGRVQSRARDIELFAKRIIKPAFIEHGPLDVSIYGDTAVVTGLDHLGGTNGGRTGDFHLRFTDVLVKRGGQ